VNGVPDETTIPRQHCGIDHALADEPSPNQQIELVKQVVAPLMTPDSMDWVFVLADLTDRNGLSLDVIRRCAANLAWSARELGQRVPDEDDWRRCDRSPSPAAARRLLTYVHGYRLRYDFKFDQLAGATRSWLAELPDDALVRSLAAFAALGQRSERAEPLLSRVTVAPDYDRSCRWVCLHGLWFGQHLPDQADRILALSDEMIGRGDDDSNLYYWRALALRRLGRLDEALASVDLAISLLPVGLNPVHQDYVRERELISTTRLLNQQVDSLIDQIRGRLREEFEEHLAQVKADLERQSSTARRIVSESLLGLVEVLALFVTLAGFLVGSGAVVLQADGFWQNLAGIALLLVGAVSFFVLLRTVVRFEPDRAGHRSGLAGLARSLRLRDRKD
jgi:tetratricopeptide (TPR) repeat protein